MSYYYRRMAKGQCAQCTLPAVEGYTRCSQHIALDREKQRLYRIENKELCRQRFTETRQTRKAAAQCLNCDEPALSNRTLCEKHRQMQRDRYARCVYKITQDELDQLRAAKYCGLCLGEFEGSGSEPLAPAIDHDHTTGKIRSVIHNRCNLAIGIFNESTDLMQLAIKYLEGFK